MPIEIFSHRKENSRKLVDVAGGVKGIFYRTRRVCLIIDGWLKIASPRTGILARTVCALLLSLLFLCIRAADCLFKSNSVLRRRLLVKMLPTTTTTC